MLKIKEIKVKSIIVKSGLPEGDLSSILMLAAYMVSDIVIKIFDKTK